MRKKLAEAYRRLSLVSRIRFSYIIPFVPVLLLSIYTYYNFWVSNQTYGDMIGSVVKASTFNMDFKHDFDYETYLLIVGQREIKESPLYMMLDDAGKVVEELETVTNNSENSERLKDIKNYLKNLDSYLTHITENLSIEGTYDQNMQIWENDVQVGTALLQESVYRYIFYEVRELEQEWANQQKVFKRVISISIIAYILVVILMLIISYYFNILLRQVRNEQVQLRKAELMVLQSQINPHFLYNTLDAITWLAEAGEQETVVKMVGSLSGFFRTSLNQGKDIVTLAEELQHIRSYLEIQKIRYQDILEYDIDVSDEFGDVKIPKITLQPLVENAIYHGIKNKRGGGKISVTAKSDSGDLRIYVRDDGVGMDEERLHAVLDGIFEKKPEEKDIYGLYNVNERIRLYFGEEYGITLSSEKGIGTESVVRLPVNGGV